MSVANSSWRKQNNHNAFWFLLETTASGVILELAVGNHSESVRIAVPHKPQIMYIRAPSHPGTERGGSMLMQTVHAVDVAYSAKGWKGLSLQIRGPFCMVLLHYVVPLQLTQLVILAIANLLASFRSM